MESGRKVKISQDYLLNILKKGRGSQKSKSFEPMGRLMVPIHHQNIIGLFNCLFSWREKPVLTITLRLHTNYLGYCPLKPVLIFTTRPHTNYISSSPLKPVMIFNPPTAYKLSMLLAITTTFDLHPPNA